MKVISDDRWVDMLICHLTVYSIVLYNLNPKAYINQSESKFHYF